ncbi:MAG TPA: hypothetical protein VN837_13320 [Chloroflexota bacterium]|nr:hypothetical protein [Chloroflexota bacterium]
MGLCANANLAYLLVSMRQDELRLLKHECRVEYPFRPIALPRRITRFLLLGMGRRMVAWGERVE